MLNDNEQHPKQVPSLVQLCQRVVSTNIDRMFSLGENPPLELIRPALQHCSAETLLRFENASPSLADGTSDIWKALCYNRHPLLAEQQYSDGEPDSWRDAYFVLNCLEEQRLEEVRLRLRSQREEAEQRKKHSQIKITDKVPPNKRFRTSWGPNPPKTLLQKTRSEVAKVQKGLYGMRMIPMPTPKSARFLPSAPSAMPSSPTTSSSTLHVNTGPRVAVTTVSVCQPSSKNSTKAKPPQMSPPLVTPNTRSTDLPALSDSCLKPSPSPLTSPPVTTLPPNSPTPMKSPLPKKNPMNALFMPKHRAYSQLSSTQPSVRSRS
ncbi:hypothetical protein C8Q75DRAFT_738822 [Abortiporus biennis]|nr:hypothetical protein C8Q75DRAFT_738822 [Abortiporus biennis]